MKAGKILIVEDDPLWQEFLRFPLADEYSLTVVSNKTEAEQVLNTAKEAGKPFDVVTVDIGLEHDISTLGGEDILALIKQHHQDTKCIVVSGHHSVGTTRLRNYFKEFDVFDYVGKADFDLTSFKQIVDKAFDFHGYRIIEELGRGGMGVVYKALDPQHDNRVVALKVLHSQAGLSPEAAMRRIARFIQEVETIRRLDHPNIVTVYDYSSTDRPDDQLFFVMEYLEGKTLDAILATRQKLPIAQTIAIGTQVCEALAFAHQAQVIHRDIKPSNIVVLPEGQVKITDFGIAKIMNTTNALTRTEEIIGTLDYMPPEQILNTKQVDHRVDIYATGVLLYEMLSGHKPYTDALLKLQAEPVPLLAVAPQLPPCLTEAIMKALASKPDDRYQTINLLARALQEF